MEKRALLAFVLSMAVFIVWSMIFGGPGQAPIVKDEPAADKSAKDNTQTDQPYGGDSGGGLETVDSSGDFEIPDDRPAKIITVETDLYTLTIDEKGGRLSGFQLKKYRSEADLNSPPKELVIVPSDDKLPLGLDFINGNGPNLSRAVFLSKTDYLDVGYPGQTGKIELVYVSTDGFEVVRTFTFTAGSYLFDLKDTLINRTDQTINDQLVLKLASSPITNKERYAGFAGIISGELEEIPAGDVAEDIEELNKKSEYSVEWAGYSDQYFIASVLPADQERTRILADKIGEAGVSIDFVNPPLIMPPQTEKTYSYQIYYGPKDYSVLKDMDNGLERAIDFGFFNLLSRPLLMFMTWLFKYVGNYGIVIILVTLLIKIIFWPLTAKSYKSMKSMQKLQPKIMKLREKYKDDRQAMNQEMMQLYKTYKVNPLGGCLPMVIQIPVFISLYRLLDYSLELRHAPFWLWITDLSTPDRLFHFDIKLPLLEPPTGIPVLTLLMGASMLLQQKMTPTPGDPTQAKIMMLMPIFFTFIFINFPAGLVLYWLVNNLLSIGQQTLINKRPS